MTLRLATDVSIEIILRALAIMVLSGCKFNTFIWRKYSEIIFWVFRLIVPAKNRNIDLFGPYGGENLFY